VALQEDTTIASTEAAFPVIYDDLTTPGITDRQIYIGMTLRDWFAGQAINGMLAAPLEGGVIDPNGLEDRLAQAAYRYADAILKARKS
jgi:hypothetical protein